MSVNHTAIRNRAMGKAEKKDVAAICEKLWEKHKSNCSGLVRDVASECGITLTGQANNIIDQIQKPPWIQLSDGIQARAKATEGHLVIGGLKALSNGHVVVVVAGPMEHLKYPSAYWGKLNDVGKKNRTVNWSWNKTDRDKVIYSAIKVKAK